MGDQRVAVSPSSRENCCTKIMDTTVLWAFLCIVTLGVGGYICYLFMLIYLNIPPNTLQYKTRLIPAIGGPIIFIFAAIMTLMCMKFIILLIMPTKAKRLPRLSELEGRSSKGSDDANAESLRFKRQFKEDSARGRSESDARFATLYSSIKKKVTTEARFKVLEEGLPTIEAFSKDEVNKIMTLFPLEEDSLRAFDLLEPHMLTEEEAYQRELANKGNLPQSLGKGSQNSSLRSEQLQGECATRPAPRQSKWVQRNIESPGNDDQV
eukprot:GEMP01051729.1.p1 GENE.GEMP01051729.1~~GEMP01051729.1.p1  ORF type:complete len:266 (+),score=34.11 GEMP01051729.1:562-1359(+)